MLLSMEIHILLKTNLLHLNFVTSQLKSKERIGHDFVLHQSRPVFLYCTIKDLHEIFFSNLYIYIIVIKKVVNI